MVSNKLRVQMVCAVVLTGVGLAACSDLTPIPAGGSAGTANMNSGSSGSSPVDNSGGSAVSTGATGGDTSTATGGTGGSDSSTAGTVSTGGDTTSAGSGGASAGSGGSGATAGSTSTGGGTTVDMCAHTGARTQTNLTPTDGRLTCATNDFGIEGDWKLNSSDPQLMTVDFTGSNVCGKGQIAQVIATATSNGAPDYGRYWGGGLAFALHTESAGGTSEPYDATTNGLGGISATISGATIPAEMRFKFKMFGSTENYCKEVMGATSGQTITLMTGDAVHNCWAPDNTMTLDATSLENYEVQVVSQTTANVPFDFCLTNISAIAAN